MVWFPFGFDLDIDFKSNLIQIQVLNAIKAGKSRAEACSFLDFMDSPSNTLKKWPLRQAHEY